MGFLSSLNYIHRLEILVGIGIAVLALYILHALDLLPKKD